jgi:4-amino-4-deoxy-L-arabinose transferase-like glycosyltransferase
LRVLQLALAGPWASPLLLCSGLLLCWALFAHVLGRLSEWLARFADGVRLGALLGIGVVAQVVVAVLTAPIRCRTFITIHYIARQIAEGLPYVDEFGRRALRPPGWPLTFAPFTRIFGPTLVATVLANIVLYLCGAYATWSLASRLFGRRAAVIATVLFTFWPSRLLMAGLAAKENLLIASVVAGTALCFSALDPSTRRPWVSALAAGIAFGLAGLTQPGLLVLLVSVPICYRFAIADVGIRRFAVGFAIFSAGAMITVAPWMARNCIVFDGEFCGISTNGGSVFYRANNANATGVFTTARGTPLSGLPELEQNRLGYELGRQWILAHPLEMAKLTLRKELAYLGSDDYGAYWSLLRGAGGGEDEAVVTASAVRIAFYRLASGASLVYWVLLAALCVQAIRRWPSTASRESHAVLPFVYPLLSGAVVFGVFESGDRQHMFAVAPLIVLAVAGVVQRG